MITNKQQSFVFWWKKLHYLCCISHSDLFFPLLGRTGWKKKRNADSRNWFLKNIYFVACCLRFCKFMLFVYELKNACVHLLGQNVISCICYCCSEVLTLTLGAKNRKLCTCNFFSYSCKLITLKRLRICSRSINACLDYSRFSIECGDFPCNN